MKVFLACAFLCIIFSVNCEKNKNDKIEKLEKIENKSEHEGAMKSKRSFHHHGLGYSTHGLSYNHGLGYGHAYSYALPSAYALGHSSHHHHLDLAPTVYSKFPTVYKGVSLPTTYALTHGGATVHSYNVNFPKYNYIVTKPLVHVARPAVIPAQAVFPSKAVSPFAVPHLHSHRVPFVIPQPVAPVVPSVSHVHPIQPSVISTANFIPQLPGTNVFNLQPAWQPVVPQVQPFAPSAPFSPAQRPVSPISPFLPFSHGISPATAPLTPPILPASPPLPAPVNPIAGNPAVNHPSIHLLPPFFSSGSNPIGAVGPSDVQPAAELPQQPNNYYLTPSETANAVPDEFSHSQEHIHHHQQQQHQQQQQQQQYRPQLQNLIQQRHRQPKPLQSNQQLAHQIYRGRELQKIQHLKQLQHHDNFYRSQRQRTVTSLANQGYEPPSNNGQYFGPSSYEVAIGSRTNPLQN